MIRLIIPGKAVAKGRPRFARRGNKYPAIKTVCGAGHKHDSKREAAKCDDLHLALKAGYISKLVCQVPFDLFAFNLLNDERAFICKYIADFVYVDQGRQVVMDVKGMRTPIYNLKRRLMKACWGIEIVEDKPPRSRRRSPAR
jgi:hypothetical protein